MPPPHRARLLKCRSPAPASTFASEAHRPRGGWTVFGIPQLHPAMICATINSNGASRDATRQFALLRLPVGALCAVENERRSSMLAVRYHGFASRCAAFPSNQDRIAVSLHGRRSATPGWGRGGEVPSSDPRAAGVNSPCRTQEVPSTRSSGRPGLVAGSG